MPLAFEKNQAVLDSLRDAAQRVQLFLDQEMSIGGFQTLLRLAKGGIAIDVMMTTTAKSRQQVNEQYFQKLIKMGGRVLQITDYRNVWKDARQNLTSFLLIDDACLYRFSTVFDGSERGQFLHLTEGESIRTFQHIFQRMAEQAEVNRSSKASTIRQPLISKFSVDRNKVLAGQAIRLQWETQFADWVVIRPVIGEVSPIGQRVITLQEDTELELIASSNNASVSRLLSVEIDRELRFQYRICVMEIDEKGELELRTENDMPHHYGVVEGQLIVLYWEAQNASGLSLETAEQSHRLPTTGRKTMMLDRLSHLKFTVSNSLQTIEQHIVIRVFPLPNIRDVQLDFTGVNDAIPVAEPEFDELHGVEASTSSLESLLADVDEDTRNELDRRWKDHNRTSSLWQQIRHLFQKPRS